MWLSGIPTASNEVSTAQTSLRGADRFSQYESHDIVDYVARLIDRADNTSKQSSKKQFSDGDDDYFLSNEYFGENAHDSVVVSPPLEEADRWQISRSFDGHLEWPGPVAFSSNGRQLASASQDRTIRLWDSFTGETHSILKGHSERIRAVAFSPNGERIVSGSDDKTVKLWNLATPDENATLKGHSGIVTTVAFSPDGKQIASASEDKTIRLWDSQGGEMRKILRGHLDWVEAVVFSPNGEQIVSASGDRTIRGWDRATGVLRDTFEGHSKWLGQSHMHRTEHNLLLPQMI